MKILKPAAFACAIVIAASAAHAQDKGDRNVAQYSCKDVMRESGGNRDVAVAFLHGYLTGKSGGDRFNVEMLRKQTDAFIERCLDNPGMKAVDAMTEAKK